MLAWRCAAFVNRTCRIGPKTFVLFREIDEESGGSCVLNPTVVHLSLLPLHFCHHPFSVFYLVVPQLSCAETSTLCRIYIPILTHRVDIREDANSDKVIWCKYISSSLCKAVDWSSQTDSFL